jgi:quercetin dioxygenase-like cupin family protein
VKRKKVQMKGKTKAIVSALVCTILVLGGAAYLFIGPGNNAHIVVAAPAETDAEGAADDASGASGTAISLRIGEPTITVNGREEPIDENGTIPLIQNGRTLLPVRAVAEAMGGVAAWDGATRTVTLTHDGDVIRMVIGSATLYLNEAPQTMDVAPVIINSRTMLPIRFIAEGFGYDVGWDGASREITITDSNSQTESGNGIAKTQDALTFPLGNALNSPSFAGTAYFNPMIANDEVFNFPQTNNITFEPGARSGWHTHGGMVILVTGGVGYYQEEGQTAKIIRKGDVVESAPGVKHWHGATSDSWFSQMVIYDSHYEGGGNEGEGTVTDEYYAGIEAEEYAGRVVTADNKFMFQRAESPILMETFNGQIYLSSVLGRENILNAPSLSYVVFEPSVRNNWHIHEGGQVLIATDGIGYHQIEGQPVEVLYPGDVAFCPPGEKHWHGASADSWFAHIAIGTNPGMGGVEWLEPLSDEEYINLPTRK